VSAADWADKDFYKVLGVPKNADPAAIKKAYRKLARDNHPDHHKGDRAAEARFKSISEANSILSDPAKRKEYDEARSLFGSGPLRGFGRGTATPGGTGSQGGFGFDLGDLFGPGSGRTPGGAGGAGAGGLGDVLGGIFKQTGRTTTSRGRRGADVESEVRISFADSVDGVTVPLRTTSSKPCPACRGTGAKAGTMPRICTTCQGTGMRLKNEGGFATTEPCRDCRGRGLVVDEACPECHGSGRAASTSTMRVRIPAGAADGTVLRLRGKGAAGENGGPPGDLLLAVTVEPDSTFARSGDNLTTTVSVPYLDAVFGGSVSVPTLEGRPVTLKVPENTPSGRVFRVRGRGVARKDGTRGDLLATVQYAGPDSMDAESKEALRKVRDNRAADKGSGSAE
jgi:molecular chaperone DnaJ